MRLDSAAIHTRRDHQPDVRRCPALHGPLPVRAHAVVRPLPGVCLWVGVLCCATVTACPLIGSGHGYLLHPFRDARFRCGVGGMVPAFSPTPAEPRFADRKTFVAVCTCAPGNFFLMRTPLILLRLGPHKCIRAECSP